MTRPVKVLHLLSSAEVGGAEMMTWRLVGHMDKRRFESHVAFWLGTGPMCSKFEGLGVPVTVLNWRPARALQALADLVRLLRRERFDIVQVYGLKANLFVRPIAALCGRPYFVTAQRSIDSDRRAWHSWIDRLTSPLVHLYLCNSEAASDILAQRERIPHKKLAVVHNGIDPTPFERDHKARAEIRAELQLPPGVPLVTVVANLRTPKGHRHLLEALALLPRQGQAWKVALVGEGPLREELEQQADRLQISDRVIFMGARQDIPRVLAAADLFVLPSLWEGLPGAVMEAMAAGLPVVASDVGGVRELLCDGETGYLVPAAQPEPLAERLQALLADAALRERMGAAGRTRLIEEFSLDRMVQRTGSVYEALCAKPKLEE